MAGKAGSPESESFEIGKTNVSPVKPMICNSLELAQLRGGARPDVGNAKVER